MSLVLKEHMLGGVHPVSSQDKESPLSQTHNSHRIWNTTPAAPLAGGRGAAPSSGFFISLDHRKHEGVKTKTQTVLTCQHKMRNVLGKQMFMYLLDQPVPWKWGSEHVWHSAVILDCKSTPRYQLLVRQQPLIRHVQLPVICQIIQPVLVVDNQFGGKMSPVHLSDIQDCSSEEELIHGHRPVRRCIDFFDFYHHNHF